MPRPTTLVSLQYVRALAAISVALFHYRSIYVAMGGDPRVAALADHGGLAVQTFFALAGFVMVLTTGLQDRPLRFLYRRLLRIYGGFLPLAIAFLIYKAATNGIDHFQGKQGLDIVGSFTLTQIDAGRLLIYPAWTLPYELLFYFSFALCLVAGRRWFWPMALVVALGYMALGFGRILPAGQAAVFANAMNMNFLAGMVAGVGYLRCRDAHLPTSFFWVPGLALIVLGVSQGGTAPWEMVCFGTGSAAVMLALTVAENRGQVPNFRALAMLGDASYAIYLIHAPLIYIMWTTPTNAHLISLGGPALALMAYISLLLAASIAYHFAIERPVLSAGRHLLQRRAGVSRTGFKRSASDQDAAKAPSEAG